MVDWVVDGSWRRYC